MLILKLRSRINIMFGYAFFLSCQIVFCYAFIDNSVYVCPFTNVS